MMLDRVSVVEASVLMVPAPVSDTERPVSKLAVVLSVPPLKVSPPDSSPKLRLSLTESVPAFSSVPPR